MKKGKVFTIAVSIIAIVCAFLFSTMLSVSCAHPQAANDITAGRDDVCTKITTNFYRCVDKKANVVCWAVTYGVDCMSIDDTDLEGYRE